MLRYTTDRQTGLVAFYDIRPGNGAGLFLQSRNPHGLQATLVTNQATITSHQVCGYVWSQSSTVLWQVFKLHCLVTYYKLNYVHKHCQ